MANPYPFVIAQIPSVDGSIIVTGIPIKKCFGLLSLLSMEITVTGYSLISMESPVNSMATVTSIEMKSSP